MELETRILASISFVVGHLINRGIYELVKNVAFTVSEFERNIEDIQLTVVYFLAIESYVEA